MAQRSPRRAKPVACTRDPRAQSLATAKECASSSSSSGGGGGAAVVAAVAAAVSASGVKVLVSAGVTVESAGDGANTTSCIVGAGGGGGGGDCREGDDDEEEEEEEEEETSVERRINITWGNFRRFTTVPVTLTRAFAVQCSLFDAAASCRDRASTLAASSMSVVPPTNTVAFSLFNSIKTATDQHGGDGGRRRRPHFIFG